MRQCKYYNECSKKDVMNTLLNALGYTDTICLCSNYKPNNPKVDPYWKDIIDETNRRLYGLSVKCFRVFLNK